jgi:hypothetical protein
MPEFKMADRVRVRNLSSTGSQAGRTGEVVGVLRNAVNDATITYNVRLDGGSLGLIAAFWPNELEPETSNAK